MEITTRDATTRDVELITQIHIASWKTAYKGIVPQDYLDHHVEEEKRDHWIDQLNHPTSKNDFVLIAMENEKPVGFIAVYEVTDDKYDAFIDNLHVIPDQKGRGIGSILMAATAHKLISMKKRSVYLWVFDKNIPAYTFYEKIGGTPDDKSIFTLMDTEIVQTRFYWNDLDRLVR
jgi:ribosomal protein S18 acetylase RimI-like enzyme